MVDDSSTARGRTPLRNGLEGLLSRPRTLWALAAVAMALDVALTGVGLAVGLVERNPLADAAIDAVGLFGAGVVLKGGALAVGYAGWRLLPCLVPGTTPLRNLVPLGVAVPSWIAVGVNAALVLPML